jgi:hypothetical protein
MPPTMGVRHQFLLPPTPRLLLFHSTNGAVGNRPQQRRGYSVAAPIWKLAPFQFVSTETNLESVGNPRLLRPPRNETPPPVPAPRSTPAFWRLKGSHTRRGSRARSPTARSCA